MILAHFDNSLYRVKSERLFESLLRVLSGKRMSGVDDALSLFEKELALFTRVLKHRSRVIELLVKLDQYRRFKQEVLKTYMEKLGLTPSDKPRLRICRNYGNESVCIATRKTTRWIDDETVYREFKKYLQIKRATIETLKQYNALLSQLLESDYEWVRKLARFLLNELKIFSKIVRDV